MDHALPFVVVALAFYGVTRSAGAWRTLTRGRIVSRSLRRGLEDLHGDLQIHQKADEAHREAEDVHEETARRSLASRILQSWRRGATVDERQIQRASPRRSPTPPCTRMPSRRRGGRERRRRGDADAVNPRSPAPKRNRASSAASITGPFTSIAAAARTAIKQNVGGNIDEEDDEDDALTADPSIVPKELSTHWSGFLTEIFVFKNTVMPSLLPQIALAFFLGIFAQMFKRVMCGADVVAAAECQTTFDITGHQVVSVSLGFLLVFRTDWAYDRYYEGKQSLGQLYNGLRNLNVCFVNYLRENKPGERAAFEASGSSNLEGWGDAGPHLTDSPSRAPRSFQSTIAKITEDRASFCA